VKRHERHSYRTHRAVIFVIAQLSCNSLHIIIPYTPDTRSRNVHKIRNLRMPDVQLSFLYKFHECVSAVLLMGAFCAEQKYRTCSTSLTSGTVETAWSTATKWATSCVVVVLTQLKLLCSPTAEQQTSVCGSVTETIN